MTKDSFDKIEELLKKETQGDYKIDGMLGRGGMAVVYLAHEVHLSRKVAIKVLPPELTFGHGVERFKREAKTAAALDHPNIIPIYRVSTEGTLFWYAMKYLEGQSLEQMLKDRPKVPLDLAIKILRQVADALDYAHEHQVVHRDMKPANVMLDNRNRVIVTDFGIAKALSEGTLTASGSVIGTPYFMSPEQGMGKMVSGASDQYSVAVMAYRMLAGHVPFEGDSAIDVLHKHCMVQPPPLETEAPGLPRHVYLAIHRALDKKAEHRFPTVSALVDGMESASALGASSPAVSLGGTGAGDATLVVGAAGMSAADLATTPMPSLASSMPGMSDRTLATPPTPQTMPPRPAPPPAKKKRSPVGLIAAAVIVVGGGAAGAYFATRGGPAPEPAPPTAVETTAPATQQAQTPAQQRTETRPTSEPQQQEPVAAAPTQQATPPPAANAQTRTSPTQPAPARETPAPPTTGTLIIQGMPSGGTVTVGGRVQQGSRLELPAGRHSVQLIHPNYETQEATVTLRAGSAEILRFQARELARQQAPAATPPVRETPPPAQPTQQPAAPTLLADQGILRISVSPVAEIFISGESRGVKSRMIDTLLAGGYLIRMVPTDASYTDTSFALEVRPGTNPPVVVQLRRR